ncbi:TetR/AcrR family transcriptional regulator [Amphritea sp. 2_MG-2023]|uniref:TetR/AcrR family transcriptional regulator n=1 Tax=Amphritea TaxID=515417 RepID=UPI001C066C5F|nr:MULTISPECIES: TetR/AcrR family transcriptional regulator [Amphritea]MBU2964635.1 TetR/AcrR family transcriptional regulator [Amphritea atlantica]MDO6420423.1 TetR/AcrR family transcriptional regulator [Amphritea sp. 2_MG-2023]
MTVKMSTPVQLPRTQAQRSAETQMLLLDATIDTLIEVGYTRASTMEIVKRSGVSRGAQVHHYGSKTGLITAATKHLFSGFIDELEELALQVRCSDNHLEAFLDGTLEKFFHGRFFFASLELIIAARTDTSLKENLIPLIKEFHYRLDELWDRFFVSTDASPANVATLLNMTLCLLRGMAVQSVLREDPDYYTEIINTWKIILLSFLTKRDN